MLTPYCAQKRHQSDAELNARKAKVLSPDSTFVDKKWKDISVGDVVRMERMSLASHSMYIARENSCSSAVSTKCDMHPNA